MSEIAATITRRCISLSCSAYISVLFAHLEFAFASRYSYVFDPEFGEDSLARRLLGDYVVPK